MFRSRRLARRSVTSKENSTSGLFERTKGGQQVVLTSPDEAFAAQGRLALVHADRAFVHPLRTTERKCKYPGGTSARVRQKKRSVTLVAIRPGLSRQSCLSGESIPVWLLFLCEGANLHTPKGQKNEF
jgi:hypothetical protein